MAERSEGQFIPNDVMQALLNRLDHVEFNLAAQSRDDISQLQATVNHMREARILEAEDSFLADALAAAPRPVFGNQRPQADSARPVMGMSHRGEGALPPTPAAPAPRDLMPLAGSPEADDSDTEEHECGGR